MKVNKRGKNILSFFMRMGFSILLLWYVFTKIDVKNTMEMLRIADLSYIFYALIIFLFLNAVLLLRWFIFIKALGLTVSAINVARYFSIGLFGNLFLPSSIGGDLIKTIGLCKESPQKARVVASVLLDRLSGFASIILVAVFAFVLGYRFINDPSLAIPISIMASGALLVASVLFNKKIYSFGCKIFNRLPKIKKGLMDLHYDIMLLKNNKREGFKAIGLSCMSQVFFSYTFFLVAKALHQDIELIYFLIFVPLICIASSFPSIGGLGVREAGSVYLFAKAGVESGVSVSISLTSFLFMIIAGLLGGIIYVSTLSAGRVQHNPSDSGFGYPET